MPMNVRVDGNPVLSLTADQISTAAWTGFETAPFTVDAGSHTIAFVNGTLAGDHATVIDNVRLVAQSGYGAWAAAHNLVGGPDDDPNGDGLSNFMKYAFGLDPNSGASVNPIADISAAKTAGTFSCTRLTNSGLNYTVWTSDDLETWTEQPGATQHAGDAVDGVETVEVTLGEIPTSDSLFIRVKAQ